MQQGDLIHRKVSFFGDDFYLIDYDITLEHFGIDRGGNVPESFSGQYGRSARDVYQSGMAWKRNLHIQLDKELIESYSYENKEGILIEELSR